MAQRICLTVEIVVGYWCSLTFAFFLIFLENFNCNETRNVRTTFQQIQAATVLVFGWHTGHFNDKVERDISGSYHRLQASWPAEVAPPGGNRANTYFEISRFTHSGYKEWLVATAGSSEHTDSRRQKLPRPHRNLSPDVYTDLHVFSRKSGSWNVVSLSVYRLVCGGSGLYRESLKVFD